MAAAVESFADTSLSLCINSAYIVFISVLGVPHNLQLFRWFFQLSDTPVFLLVPVFLRRWLIFSPQILKDLGTIYESNNFVFGILFIIILQKLK